MWLLHLDALLGTLQSVSSITVTSSVSVCEPLQWLLEQRLVQKLVEMIDPSRTSEVISRLHFSFSFRSQLCDKFETESVCCIYTFCLKNYLKTMIACVTAPHILCICSESLNTLPPVFILPTLLEWHWRHCVFRSSVMHASVIAPWEFVNTISSKLLWGSSSHFGELVDKDEFIRFWAQKAKEMTRLWSKFYFVGHSVTI